MNRKNKIQRVKKNLTSASIGLLCAASILSASPLPVYAAQTSGRGPAEVSSEKSQLTEESGHAKSGQTIFEVMEIDRVFYYVTVKVIDAKTKELLPSTMVYFELINDNGTSGGLVFAEGFQGPTDMGENGERTYKLEKGKSYKVVVINYDYENYDAVWKFDDGDGYGDQTKYRTIELVKKSGGGGNSGGGNGGGSGDNDGPHTTKPAEKPTEKPTEAPTKPAEVPTEAPTNPSEPDIQPTNPNKPTTPETKPGQEPEKPGKPKDEYIVPGPDNKTGTDDDIIVRPGKDENGNNNSSQDKDGKVDLPDGGEVIIPTYPDKGDIKVDVPPGTVIQPDGTITLPDDNQETTITIPGRDKELGTDDDVIIKPGLDENGKNNTKIDTNGDVTLPDGGNVDYPSFPDQGRIHVDVPKGTVIHPDGTWDLPDGEKNKYRLPGKDAQIVTDEDVFVDPDAGADGNDSSYLDEKGWLHLPDGGLVTYPDGEEIHAPAGSIILPDGTIIYPGEDLPADTTPTRIGFWDCYFHWIELLALLAVIGVSVRRLYVIKKTHEQLDEIEFGKYDNSEEV